MSKNLNRRFFYDFLIKLANEQINKVTHESNPLILEDGISKAEEQKLKNVKSSKSLIDQPDQGPPPLMQGEPRILKKVPTV